MTATLVMCVPVAGLRVSSGSCCSWQPRCLTPLDHRSPDCALVSDPFYSVPLSHQKDHNVNRSFR